MSYECESSSSTLQASSHFDDVPFIPSFHCIRSISTNTCIVRLQLKSAYAQVGEVVRITCFLIKPLGVTSTLLLLLPCYARRRGLGLSDIHDRCEMFNNGST